MEFHLNTADQICLVVTALVGVGCCQSKQIFVPGMGGFRVTLISLGFQLQKEQNTYVLEYFFQMNKMCVSSNIKLTQIGSIHGSL